MVEFKLEIDQITPAIERQLREIQKLPQQALPVFVDNTARRSGNAQRNTRLSGDVIQANYPYARRLDHGWSKQKPQGMTKPTFDFITRKLNQILGK
jgi:hypothetical protein